MTPMTEDEIREFYEDRQSDLSRNFYTALASLEQAIKETIDDFDVAMLRDQYKATIAKFHRDCHYLEDQQRAAMISAMPKGGIYWPQYRPVVTVV